MHLRSAVPSVSSPSQHHSTRSLCSLAQHALWGCALCLQEVLSLWMCFSLLEKICFHPPQSGRTTRLQQHFTWEWWNLTLFRSLFWCLLGKKRYPIEYSLCERESPPIYCSTQFFRYVTTVPSSLPCEFSSWPYSPLLSYSSSTQCSTLTVRYCTPFL